MKSKLAIWSWVLPVIGFLTLNFFSLADEVFPSLGIDKDSVIGLFVILVFAVFGLVFGTVALKEISRNPQLTGRGHAVLGRILSLMALLLGLLGLASGLFCVVKKI